MCKLSNHYRSDPVQVQSTNLGGATVPCTTNHTTFTYVYDCWAEAPVKIARKTLTIKLDRNWSSFQLANNTPPLSVTGSVIAPSARMRMIAAEWVQLILENFKACLRGIAAQSSARDRLRDYFGSRHFGSRRFWLASFWLALFWLTSFGSRHVGSRHFGPRHSQVILASSRNANLLPQRVCCSCRCAIAVQHSRSPEQAREDTSPKKNTCDKQVSSWRHIRCHTDKNRYYT